VPVHIGLDDCQHGDRRRHGGAQEREVSPYGRGVDDGKRWTTGS